MMEILEIIQEITSLFSGPPIYLMPKKEAEMRTYLKEIVSPKLGIDLSNHAAVAQICTLDSDHIYEYTPLPGIQALTYSNQSEGNVLLVGPVTNEKFSVHQFSRYLQQQGASEEMIEKMSITASELPTMNSYTLHQFMDILIKHLYSLEYSIPIKSVEREVHLHEISPVGDVPFSKDIRQIRMVENRYEISVLLTEAVKLGNLSLALQTLEQFHTQFDQIIRNDNPLRNMQNLCIVLNTQLRQALQDGDIHPYQLDHVSNEIGMQIERLTSIQVLEKFGNYIIEQYCHLVQEHSYQNLSPLTHQAVVYIKNNLSANLTVMDTAKELSVHPDYLSHQFRKEMGMTFIEFVNRERCEQAASLLKHTSLQIKLISAIAGFNTISYFTKQFVKIYGITPRDYRNKRIYRKPSVNHQQERS